MDKLQELDQLQDVFADNCCPAGRSEDMNIIPDFTMLTDESIPNSKPIKTESVSSYNINCNVIVSFQHDSTEKKSNGPIQNVQPSTYRNCFYFY